MINKEDILCFFLIDDIVFAFKKKDQPNVKEIVNALERRFKLEKFEKLKWFFRIHIFRDKDKRLL